MKYIFIAFIFCACNGSFSRTDSPTISTELLDTIKSAPVSTGAVPIIFEHSFIPGTRQNVKGTDVGFTGITIGQIKIPSGHIIACDPMHIDKYGKPFTRLFPTGEFPVQLSILELDGEESIAFARINFSDAAVERWEFALLEGQPAIPVGGKKMHGYSVDAGVGVFIDAAANKELNKEAVTLMDRGIYKEMEKHLHPGWRYAMYDVGPHNLATFSSGLGDGYYASYIGFAANGTPCRLLTDFGLFDWKTK